MKPLLRALALATSLTLASTAQAAPIGYAFTGVVEHDEAGRGLIGFAGSFGFDPSAPDLIADPNTGAYLQPFALQIAFDGGPWLQFGATTMLLTTNDLGGEDQLGLFASGDDGEFSMALYDFSQALLVSDALPTLFGFDDLDWTELRWTSELGTLQGRLDSLACVAGCDAGPEGPGDPGDPVDPGTPPTGVPLPGTLPLAALALLVMPGVLRRRIG